MHATPVTKGKVGGFFERLARGSCAKTVEWDVDIENDIARANWNGRSGDDECSGFDETGSDYWESALKAPWSARKTSPPPSPPPFALSPRHALSPVESVTVTPSTPPFGTTEVTPRETPSLVEQDEYDLFGTPGLGDCSRDVCRPLSRREVSRSYDMVDVAVEFRDEQRLFGARPRADAKCSQLLEGSPTRGLWSESLRVATLPTTGVTGPCKRRDDRFGRPSRLSRQPSRRGLPWELATSESSRATLGTAERPQRSLGERATSS